MEGPSLHERIDQLYDIVETNNAGGIPVQPAAGTLRLVNTMLPPETAYQVAADADSRGVDELTRQDFTRAVKLVLETTEPEEAQRLVKDVVLRLRVGVRRRYLMYDAPPNTPPPQVATNMKAQQTFRDLFDLVSQGSDEITRDKLKMVCDVVLHDARVDGSTIVKAALGHASTDLISFNEFMLLMQTATTKRTLSDMLILMKKHQRGQSFEDRGLVDPNASPMRGEGAASPSRAASTVAGMRPTASNSSSFSIGGPSSSPYSTGGAGTRPMQQQQQQPGQPSIAHRQLAKEVEVYKQQDQAAARRHHDVIGSVSLNHVLPSVPAMPTKQETGANSFEAAQYERELSRLALENEELRREILKLELAAQAKPSNVSSGGHAGSRGTSVAVAHVEDEAEVLELRDQVALLEKELRVSRAHLNTARESTSLLKALQEGTSVHQAVRNHYPDESLLTAKHSYLRETSTLLDDGNSPIAIVLGQYDLLVVGYQALYREMRKKYETQRPKKFDPRKAAASIIPQGSPTPTLSPARFAKSPARHISASPMKWSELDRAPTADMKNSGMLADPLLTNEQRILLRGQLAAQMRKSARHYRPPQGRSHTPTREATVMTSLDAMSRLQTMSDRANRERHL